MSKADYESPGAARDLPARLPKLCGADVEVANFIVGADDWGGTGGRASRALLREISGLPGDDEARSWDGGSADGQGGYYSYSYSAQDWGRKFLPSNGGCVYIDLDHLELCLPEVTSAHDHVAAWHAMLLIARQALAAANDNLDPECRVQVLVNNSDGQGNSYGSHLNFLITRRAWDNIFRRKIHHMLYLAAYQASSIIFAGQGKVGSENGAPPVAFQLSQRADFLETLTGAQTTSNRPLVNSRDEALCGGWHDGASSMARLHCIFYDSNLCQAAHLLKVGVMQIILAMIEAERVNPNLILDDPLDAVVCWSHDPTLRAPARMASGEELTALELQWLFLEEAKRFGESVGYEGVVPRAGEIIALWEDTLSKLRAGDLAALAGKLDWVLKLRILQDAIERHPELGWDSPAIKHLDHLYSSLDLAEGLYWAYESAGLVERVASPADVERLVHEPPEDTRAWTRAMLLRKAGPRAVTGVDWDSIRFKLKSKFGWPRYRLLEMASPIRFGKVETGPVLKKRLGLERVLDILSPSLADAQVTN